MAANYKKKNTMRKVITNGVLILICIIWLIPIVGVLITSFRQSDKIFQSGWWTVFPHREYVQTDEIVLDDSVDADGPITLEGTTATFEEWREGITLEDGRFLQWYGNKRTRRITVSEREWVGFETDLTIQNYLDVLTGKTITYTDASGNTITRQGNDLSAAFLNSMAVSIPGTIIPILIAAFAAFGFAWLKFPGRNIFFVIIVALLVVPLQIALVPILRDYVSLGLNGTFLGIWLAHTGFGLPLATYLLYNYISTIPRELLESAFIDGASNFTIFIRLILPLSVPALASFAIFQFLWLWNDYLVALIFLNEKNRVLTYALASIVGEKGQDWHLMTAAAFVSMVVPLIVFLALQRYFVRGLMAGSVKG
ncbi:MAG: carbohydrate ABC transporter permease [Chloroflexota bacterium]|nr:carbohydrate ABC transporter permease [Chloroflexota bacterium]